MAAETNYAAICPTTQEVMNDPVICADGHSYERASVEMWLLSHNTSPATNVPLAHTNLVPNHALRNLIYEARGLRQPVTLEEHAQISVPVIPTELRDDDAETAQAGASSDEGVGAPPDAATAWGQRDEETAAAPEHAAEFAQPVQPCATLCWLSTAARTHALPSGKNALHWALCEGAAAEQRQLRLLHLDAGLAAQPDQGGNLPLHYAASTAAPLPVVVACAVAFMPALEYQNKVGHTPAALARLEGHAGIAALLDGLLNHQRNELHDAFAAGPSREADQLRLLGVRPELAAQPDAAGALPLHVAAASGATRTALERCAAAFPGAPARRDDAGFLPHQLALERGDREAAEVLAARAGKKLPSRTVFSVLAEAARTAADDGAGPGAERGVGEHHFPPPSQKAGEEENTISHEPAGDGDAEALTEPN